MTDRQKIPLPYRYPGRCHTCFMRQEVCICAEIPKIDNATFLTVIMHLRESYKTTNTARIACLALKNSRIILRGVKGAPLSMSADKTNALPVLLTLSEKSQVLSKEWVESQKQPIHLIVPDGSWRQATKVGKREPTLRDVLWVKLPPGPISRYRLRHEHLREGLSTLEAIARALSIIESPLIGEALEKVFESMVEKTLSTRPKNRQVENQKVR